MAEENGGKEGEREKTWGEGGRVAAAARVREYPNSVWIAKILKKNESVMSYFYGFNVLKRHQ